MKIAVITPYHKEPLDIIKRCHDSVLAQTVSCDHFLVADGFAREEIDGWRAKHLRLPNHADYGDTPRVVAAASVAALHYDALLFLDADNWFEPRHVEIMVEAQRSSGAPVVTCGRTLWRTNGTKIGRCRECDGKTFIDTNCYLITRSKFHMTAAWGFKDPAMSIVGDRIFWNAMRKSGATTHCDTDTVNYETNFAAHYLAIGEEPPVDAKVIIKDATGRLVMVKYTDLKNARSKK